MNDFDPLDPETFDSPFDVFRDLRAKCPVAHSNAWGGFWAFTRYDDIANAAKDSDLYITSVQNVVPKVATTGRRPPLHLDPPEHTPYRGFARTTVKDVTIRGREIKAGEPMARIELETAVERPWPPGAFNGRQVTPEFRIEVVRDPYGCNSGPNYGPAAGVISVCRRPRPTANLIYLLATGFSYDPKQGLALARDDETGAYISGNLMADARVPTIWKQIRDAAAPAWSAIAITSAAFIAGVLLAVSPVNGFLRTNSIARSSLAEFCYDT